ncbi:MAG: glucose 1-dehydrogenase [Nitrososphaerales archaeon]
MRAVAVFPSKKEVKIIDQEMPVIRRPDEVKLRMIEVGICGTDKEIASFEYGTPPRNSRFLILGHESLAEVVEIGSKVRNLKVGDLVVPSVRRPCRHKSCLPCRSGFPDFCNTGDFMERGIKGAHGFMAEYVVDHASYLHLVPEKLLDIAVLTEPLTIAEKAREETLQIIKRLPWLTDEIVENSRRNSYPRAVVLGAGAVGLLAMMILVDGGFETYVYALAPSPNPSSEVVEAVGGSYHSQGKISRETKKRLFGHIHLVYEATGVSRLAFDVLKLLAPNSLFIMTGVPSLKGPAEIDTDFLMRNIVLKNQIILGTVNASSDNYDSAITHIGKFERKWPQTVRSLITKRVAIEDAVEVLTSPQRGIKTTITFNGTSRGGVAA